MRYERERRSGAPRAVKLRVGRASLLFLAGVVVLGLAVAWFTLREPRSAGSAGPIRPLDPTPSANETALDARVERDAASPPTAADDPRRFDGRGRIRGMLEARGVELPARWTLVLEPDPTLVGSGRAEPRRVEFDAGETRFDVAGLPFAGYRVHAEAPNSNGARVSVLLVRDAPEANVTLRLAPAGFVDGMVFDDAGRPAEGLVVHIENERSRTRARGIVDATGLFIVRDVLDGEYEIRFGEWDAPLVTPGEFTFRAPSLRWPETRLPPTGSLVVHVRDEEGRGIGGLAIAGSAPPRSALRAETDKDGLARVTFLLPGRYTIEVRGTDGRTLRGAVDVAPNVERELELVFE